MRHVTAADANRNFSKLLREVEGGQELVVTSHGRPVARISPIQQRSRAELEAARARLYEHLASQPTLNLPKITRDELYDR